MGQQASGSGGKVISGPTYADGFHWWGIDYDAGADGWSAENFIGKVGTAVPDNTWVKITLQDAVQPTTGLVNTRYYGRAFSDCTPTVTMPSPVGRAFSGVAAGDGKIFMFGGGHQSHPANDVELFDITTNTWTQPYRPECAPACCS